jgi:DNA repair protein RecO (recombination protein O)
MPQPPRVYQTPAIVLRQRKLGDADKVITLYSANFGKLDAVAKGVRKATSRLAGHVEPLNHASFLLAHGRSLDIITQAQTIESFQPLRADLERLSRALYAAELVDRFTEERAENFGLYRALLDTLRRLADRDDLDVVLRFFEMTLLDMLGYRPELGACIVCGRALEPVANAWAAAAGGVVCPHCQHDIAGVRPLSVNALKLLRLLQGENFGEVARVRVSPELAEELEGDLRDSIHHALERDVRSAHFVDTLRRRRGGS